MRRRSGVTESFLRVLMRRWWIPAATLTAGLAAGFWWTSREPRIYRASAMLAVVPNSSIGDADVLRSLDSLERRTVLATFARLPTTRETLVAVAERLERNPVELANYQLGASVLPNTNIIRIDVDGPDPRMAAHLANAAGEVVGAEARSLYRIYTMRPIAAAEASKRPVHPDPGRNALAAGVLGLFVGAVVVGTVGAPRGGA
jgi:capsular polysaccharide biosynthesis protein